jgi:hypothetical protein
VSKSSPDAVVTRPEDKSRVTILEGSKIAPEFEETGLDVMNLKEVFRPGKLIDRTLTPPPDQVASKSPWVQAVKSGTPAPPGILSTSVAKTNPVVKTAPLAKNAGRSPVPIKAAAIKSSWVPGPLGLDPPLKVNATVLERVKRRTNSDKLCNNHYLRGPCAKGGKFARILAFLLSTPAAC